MSLCRTCALTVIAFCSGHGDGNNRKKKQCNWWCAACGGQYDWRAPNRFLVIQDSTDPREAKVLSSTRCTARNLRQLDSLNLLTNQVLLEKSRKGIMDGLRKFMEVDTHEA